MPGQSRTSASTEARSSRSSGGQRHTGGSASARRAPLPLHRSHLRSERIFPARVHGALDAELERDLRGMRLMLRVSEDDGANSRIVHEGRRAREVELVAARLGLRERLQRVSPIPLQVAAFGGRGGDEDEEPVAADDRANGMQARRAVLPDAGEEGQPGPKLLEQRAADLRQLGLGGGEVFPRDPARATHRLVTEAALPAVASDVTHVSKMARRASPSHDLGWPSRMSLRGACTGRPPRALPGLRCSWPVPSSPRNCRYSTLPLRDALALIPIVSAEDPREHGGAGNAAPLTPPADGGRV